MDTQEEKQIVAEYTENKMSIAKPNSLYLKRKKDAFDLYIKLKK